MGNYVGFVDSNGVVAIPPRYAYAEPFSEGYAAVRTASGQFGFVDAKGGLTVGEVLTELGGLRGGLAVAAQGDIAYGYVDRSLRFVIRPQFRDADAFSEGYAVVRNIVGSGDGGGRLAFVDVRGHPLTAESYVEAGDFSQGRAFVSGDGRLFGFIGPSGRLVIPMTYRAALPFSEGLAGVAEESGGVTRWGFIDLSGKVTIALKYSVVWPFSEGYAGVGLDDVHGLIDKRGTMVLRTQYQDLRSPHEGVMAFAEGGRWGYVSLNGKVVHGPQFDVAHDFYRGMAWVGRYATEGDASVLHEGYVRADGVLIWGDDLVPAVGH